MTDSTAGQPTVTVSRLFWVAAANALRKQAGHAISDEPQMTDEEAWRYILWVAQGEPIPLSEFVAELLAKAPA